MADILASREERREPTPPIAEAAALAEFAAGHLSAETTVEVAPELGRPDWDGQQIEITVIYE